MTLARIMDQKGSQMFTRGILLINFAFICRWPGKSYKLLTGRWRNPHLSTNELVYAMLPPCSSNMLNSVRLRTPLVVVEHHRGDVELP